MRRDLPLSDLADFLALPIVAVLATYRRDGSVLLSPVWHQWRDGGFDVLCSPNDIKVRHLRRDPRASILVYGNDLPYCGVEIRTTAQLSDIDRADFVREMSVRYLGKEAGEAYAEGSADSILVRLEPGDVRTWDFVTSSENSGSCLGGLVACDERLESPARRAYGRRASRLAETSTRNRSGSRKKVA